jgi:hypothetical protein
VKEDNMKPLRILFAALAAAIALTAVAVPAQAHGRWHGGISLSFGVPYPYYWGPRVYYGPPVYYPAPMYDYGPPPVVVAPASPPVYVERDDAAPSATRPGATWWYWCESARGYYPYVKECPGGWQRVPPQQ